MRLFDYDPKSLLASIPKMYSFPKLRDVYSAWKDKITREGKVEFLLGREVIAVARGKTVVIDHRDKGASAETPATQEFDEVIFACGMTLHIYIFFDSSLQITLDADSTLKILGKDATWKERRVLGNVKYLCASPRRLSTC
jgi:hypothetical protein